MDPFTQRLLERTRERREMLTKKMDTSPRRKRSQPLAENQAENVSTATSESDDSPNKRQCLREAEQSIKSDTPAIKGVMSRLQHLVDQREEWGSESGSTDDTKEDDHYPAAINQETKRARSEDVEECLDKRPPPRSRRSRFAALAQNINNWEDDLHQPQLKKGEKPKKVWQRPPPMETTESNNPSKPPRTFEYASETTNVVSSKSSPAKPPRFVSPAKSATVKKPASEKNVVSTLKVTLGSPAEAVSVNKTISRSPSPRKPSPMKTPVAQKRTTNLDVPSPARKSPRTSDENEPTKKPVSARLAQWQQRTEDADAEKDQDAEPTATPVSSRLAGWQQKVNQVESKGGAGPVRSTPVKKASPLKASWQARPTGHVASASKMESRTSPVKSTSPVKTPSVAQKAQQFGQQQQQQQQSSPVKAVSPSKVAPATKAIRDRLQAQLQKSWKDNEIAEKARKQKEADMAVLQNRWKNSMLKEASDTEEEAPSVEKPVAVTPSIAPGTVPPPPPLPSANSTPKQTNKSPVKKTPAKTTTPQSARHGKMNPKREEQRDKLRNETATGDGDSLENNFESKLSAMGFEVSSATNGKVATLDLTPQRERDYAARAAAASAKKTTTPASLKVTEKKVVTTTFRDAEKTTTTTTKANQKTPAPATPATTKPAAPSGGGHSIYNIIKRQAGATPATGTSTTPAAQSRCRTTPAQSSRRDSFDSDESSFESEAYDESEPESEGGYVISRQSSQTSTQSDQSQLSQYGDAQSTTDYTSQTDCTDTEGYTAEEVENDTEEDSLDDEYGSGSGSEEDCSEISDLLDEAMDETTTETESDIPVPAPRRNRLPSQDYSRPSHQSGSRSPQKSHHQPAAVERRYHAPMQPDKRVTWAAGSQPTPVSSASESEPETERRLVYSLDLYRSTRGKKNGPTPHKTIVRHSEHYRPEESEDEMPYIPEKSVRQRLQELQETINQEQSVIMQTSNALNQCCHSNSAFAGSAEAVECHRLLLLACKKREAYLTEMTHLRENRPQHCKGPQGSLTITDLRLPLKKDFQSRLSNAQGGMQVHYFLVMVRHENHVIFTQMQSTNEAVRGCLDFPNLIKYNDIRQNFKVDLEVYGMYITKEPLGQTPKKKKGLTPKKPKSKSSGLSMQSPGGPLAVRSTNFVCVAHMTITQQSLNKTHFNLDGVPYSSPMQGTIHLNLRCIMENNVEERGFLTMFEDVSGFGAWHRRWCALKNNRLSYWKYPEEEKLKEPMGYIDFKQCITDIVGVIPRDICARPNTFELVTVRRQTRGETDTLVSRCYNTMTTTKHWISADVKEDRVVWCNKLNEALRNLRAWNPDALRPIKRQ